MAWAGAPQVDNQGGDQAYYDENGEPYVDENGQYYDEHGNPYVDENAQYYDENGQPYVVDVNPNPDITPEGGFMSACAAAGYSYGRAVANIVGMAVTRRNRRQALQKTTTDRRRPAAVDHHQTSAVELTLP